MRQYGTFAQDVPTLLTLTDLYTVPAATQFVGKVRVVDESGTGTAFRLSVGVAGAADDPKQYLAYDMAIAGNVAIEVPLECGPGDVIRGYATLGTLAFTVSGCLIT